MEFGFQRAITEAKDTIISVLHSVWTKEPVKIIIKLLLYQIIQILTDVCLYFISHNSLAF